VQGGVGDVCDVGERIERSAGRFGVPQIDRQNSISRPLGSFGSLRETPSRPSRRRGTSRSLRPE